MFLPAHFSSSYLESEDLMSSLKKSGFRYRKGKGLDWHSYFI